MLKTSGYFESVHLLRGWAALLVLAAHSCQSRYFFNLPWFDKDFLDVGQIGVSVFFVISGFVLPVSLQSAYTFRDFPRFLVRRFIRIEPTYLVSMMIAVAWLWSATRLAPNATPWQFDSGQIIAHLCYWIPFTNHEWLNAVYWTLAIEFQFYIFIGLCFVAIRFSANKNAQIAAGLISLFAGSTFLFQFFPPIQLLKYAPFFCIGMLAWLVYFYKPRNLVSLSALIIISILGYFGDLKVANLLAGALAFFLILCWNPKRSKWGFFGTISYSLYVVHYPITSLQSIIGNRLIARGDFENILFLLPISTMAVSIFSAWLLYKIIEEPTIKLSKKIKYND
jgi:peptidoglycan/LPS O-acetylase OafA/YrhL